jgi:tryptophan-rich sensory protein
MYSPFSFESKENEMSPDGPMFVIATLLVFAFMPIVFGEHQPSNMTNVPVVILSATACAIQIYQSHPWDALFWGIISAMFLVAAFRHAFYSMKN